MTRKPLLVALAGQAALRLLEHDRPEAFPREIRHILAADFPDVAKSYNSPPGHGHAPGVRHGYETATVQEIQRERFAPHAAVALASAWNSGAYRGILLAAGPRMLGALRPHLSVVLAGQPIHEIALDLVNMTLADVLPHLKVIERTQN